MRRNHLATQSVWILKTSAIAIYSLTVFVSLFQDEYAFLYDLLKSYADQFSDYANFAM